MPARRLDVVDVREVVRRLRLGESDRRIAEDMDLSRNTVAKYRRWAEEEGFLSADDLPELGELHRRLETAKPPKAAGPASTVEPYRVFVERKRKEGVEMRALLALLQERGFKGSYSALRRFVGRLEDREPAKFLRVETGPGEEAQVDFGYVGTIPDAAGRPRKAWVFVMTLSYSRHQYVEVVFDQRVETWIELHVRAFEVLGGVVDRVVLDNLKAGIIKHVTHDAEAQQSYRELAEHYDFLISPCRPRTPRHKGKVESGVRYVKRNALAGRSFQSLREINDHLTRWVEEVAGRREHGTTHEQPLVRFGREREKLRPLPPGRYETVVWKKAKVHPDCHVTFEYSYYSVPHRLVGRTVILRVTPRRTEIYYEHQRMASHARAHRRGAWRTIADHYPPEKVQGLLPEPVRLRAESERIGPRTGEFIDRLLGEKPLDRLRGAQAVLRLAKKHGHERLEAACDRALRFEELRYPTVKRILEKDLEVNEDTKIVSLAGPLPRASRFARTAAELTRN